MSISDKGIPDWARNGGIAYCRWDGGPLEVAKAHLSNWDYFTNPGAVAGMMGTYTDEGLALLKNAGFNWIWLTWSAGFSYAQEEIQQAMLRPFVEKCHQAGIHCTAYMSLANLFAEDIRANQPRLLEALQRGVGGQEIPYGAARYFDKPLRLMACLNQPIWKEHLRNRLKSAIDAGFEGAFYDNISSACYCPRCRADFHAFARDQLGRDMEIPGSEARTSDHFQETAPRIDAALGAVQKQILQAYWTHLFARTMAELSQYADSLKSDFLTYCNWHVYHHTFGPSRLKALSTEDGQRPAYVGPGHEFPASPGFEVRGYVSNAGLLKRSWGAGEGWRPVRMQSHKPPGPATSMEAADFIPYTGREWQRLLAECWTFRAAQEVFVEGNFMTELFGGIARAKEAWEAIGRYNRFQRQHAELWRSASKPEAAFAVWGIEGYPEPDGDWQRTRLLTALALRGLQFDVVLNTRTGVERLREYPMLWLPSVEVITEQELEMLDAYLRSGGEILATGPFAGSRGIGQNWDEETRRRWIKRLEMAGGERWRRSSDCDDRGIWRGTTEIPQALLRSRESFFVDVRSDDGPIIWTAWRCTDGRGVVYLFNPDQRQARSTVRISVKKPAISGGSWHTPDPGSSATEMETSAAGLQCRIDRLDIFGFLEFRVGQVLK